MPEEVSRLLAAVITDSTETGEVLEHLRGHRDAQDRAKLRASIKRLLIKYKYPPDQQPGAIKLVMEQMEQLAPRFVDRVA